MHRSKCRTSAHPILFFALAMAGVVNAAGGCGGRASSLGSVDLPDGSAPSEPPTSNPETRVTTPIDSVDLLLVVDNSQSMGDKQRVLAQAIPELVKQLVNPRCADATTGVVPQAAPRATVDAHGAASCPAGMAPEFPPVSDLHVGVISTSLGTPGQDACALGTPRINDAAHLLNRKAIAAAKPTGFVAWLPPWDQNVGRPEPLVPRQSDLNALSSSIGELIGGVGESGCGFEAQLESAYRFLVQPDPYDKVVSLNNPGVEYQGIDETLLKQRAAFLRPNSLVGIVLLTDENDSTYDPRAFNSSASVVAIDQRLWKPTDTCSHDPNSKDCTSSYFTSGGDAAPRLSESEDAFNLRFFQMKRRFGFDVQFPLSRYVRGFSQPQVPGRADERPFGTEYNASEDGCTNPLFAAALPNSATDELCHLPIGTRSQNSVLFTVLGGVPWQLLTSDSKGAGELKEQLSTEDWTRMIGKDPIRYDMTGADPHMLESIAPRAPLPGVSESDTKDPFHGREHETNNQDLQYACTFALPPTLQRECPSATGYCDCNAGSKAPLCSGTRQVRGKAYPTLRELSVVRDLGAQGIAGSLCPRTLEGDPSSQDYGYNPVFRVMVSRWIPALRTLRTR